MRRHTPPRVSAKLTRAWRAAGLLATLATAQAATAQEYGPSGAASDEEVARLQKELQAAQAAEAARAQKQDEELRRLERALQEERAERAAAAQKATEVAEASQNDPSVIRARNFGLTLTGFVQADAVAWRQSSEDEVNPSTGNPLNETRFLIRRARLRADLEWKWIAGALELDGNTVNGPQARLIGAEASFVWRKRGAIPYLQLTVGLFKTPFGFEVLQSDRERLFLERSNTERALFPGEYDLGVRLSGGWRFLRYAISAMNGDPVGEKAFPGRDPNESKDFVGRLGVDFEMLKRRLGIRAGFSWVYGTGFHKGIAASKDTLVWRDLNEDGAVQPNEIQVIQGQTAQPSKNFDRYAIGGDLELSLRVPRLGELMLYGEVVWATNLDRATLIADPLDPMVGRDLRELGYYVAITQELTKYALIGLRYDIYNPDRDANQPRGGVQVPKDSSYSTLAVAAALQYPPWGRLILEYDHNTNPLGRTQSGAVTTLPDDALTLRGQVAF
jgi:hypothetical protein